MATVRKRNGHGGYEVRFYGPDGKRQSRTFGTKKEATKYGQKMEVAKDDGTYIDPRKARTPFKDVAQEWLDTRPGNKQQTRDGYEQLLRKHVLPALGDTAVGKITKARVRQFVADMHDGGAAPGTIRNTFRNVLKPVLDIAVESGYVLRNVAVGVKLPKSRRTEALFLTVDEVEALGQEFGEPYELMVHFAAYTGLRAGEIGALRVGKLDLMRATVWVNESVAAVKGQGLVYGETKTYMHRTVKLPRSLVDPLAAYIAPRAGNPGALVFLTRNGKPLSQRTLMNDYFRPAVERLVERRTFRAELAGLRFHDLRHTAAAFMIALNPNPKVICERLGHSTINVTFDTYGHLFPGADEDLAAGLDAMRLRGRAGGAAL